LSTSAKTKILRVAIVAALLVGLYALAGFWLAPKLARNTLMDQIPKVLPGVTPSVGAIHINPFLLEVEVNDFALTDAGGTRLVGFGRLFVDFELSSIWHRAYTFARIEIDSPSANALVAKDGRLNLLQLSPAPSAPKPEKPGGGPLPAIRIGDFKVTHGLMTYEDRSRAATFAVRLEPIDFELQDFSTGVEGGRFTFTGTSKLGEKIEWHGHVTAQPIASDGEFQLVGLQAHPILTYLAERSNFSVDTGKLDLSATYQFSLKDAIDLQVEVPKATLTDLAVRPKESDVDWIVVPEIALGGARVDLAKRQAHVDSLTLSGVKLLTWMEADGSINLLKLAAPPAPPTGAAPAAAPTPVSKAAVASAGSAEPNAAAAPGWQFDLRELAVRDAHISAEDRSTKPAAKLLLAPLSLKVTGVSLDLSKPVTLSLDTRINDKGSLSVTGQVTPQPASADLQIKLAAIDLTAVQPYVAQHTSMTLSAGALSGDLKVRYGAKKPALKLTGDVIVAKLHTTDNALHQNFISWDRLDVRGVDFEHDPDQLQIDQVLASKLYARVIIEPDRTINVTRILAGPGATVTAPAGRSGAQVTETASPAPTPPRPRKKTASGKPITAAAAPAAAPMMPTLIKKIIVRASEADFADLSVTPNFAAGIQNLDGTVLGLSSKQNSRAKIDIHGSVDPFAPVSITGEVNVLGPALYTDLAMSFRNIELSTFNPYSGRFAGYNIAKGKLTTELHYKVDGRKLDAQHHIIVDQLEFGAKTESKDAVSLPIKLAVALLKDSNGVIDLDLPVTGSLDDPQFKIGPIIWKVFVNLLEKAVTAPFKLLGSLFGGGPDLQFIDFQPGLAGLDPAAAEKAKTVVKALSSRPQLKIEVPIAVVSELDRPPLVEAKFQGQIKDAQAEESARRHLSGTQPAFEQLDPAAKLEVLAQAYAQAFGGPAKFPESIAAIKTKPESTSAKIDFLSGELHQHISIGESELTALGQQRAANLQSALLTDTQISPDRVFLVANDKAKKEGGMVRLELTLR
jgi:hypothetical protein